MTERAELGQFTMQKASKGMKTSQLVDQSNKWRLKSVFFYLLASVGKEIWNSHTLLAYASKDRYIPGSNLATCTKALKMYILGQCRVRPCALGAEFYMADRSVHPDPGGLRNTPQHMCVQAQNPHKERKMEEKGLQSDHTLLGGVHAFFLFLGSACTSSN